MFISETLQHNPTNWLEFEVYLASKGFFLKEDLKDKTLQNNYNVHKLSTGKFPRGSRRRSQNSLYCKLRIMEHTEEDATKQIHIVNRKCDEPLDEKEVGYNIQYAESFFQNIVTPTLQKTKKNNSSDANYYDMALQLTEEYNFISHISKEIYYYSNGIYHKNGDKLIRKKCRQYWESMGIATGQISEIENIIRDKTTILQENENQDIFDNDYKIFILKNGMYNFGTMEFLPHSPKVLATIKHPIFYDNTKSCPNFDEFLDSCFDGDDIRITQIWEMMALCFIKKTIIQKGYVNYGIGSNGKSTFLAILRNTLGISNTTSIPMQQFQKSQFIGYELRGKSANISGDGGTEPLMKTGFIKSLLGGDAIRCEEKYRNPFDFVPFTTLIFTFNELPVVNDSSDGFTRKIQPIHWEKRFYGNSVNRDVDNIAFDADERSGIFNKLIPIIKRLLDTKKLQHENTVQETKAIWLSRSDSFFKFKNEHIIIGSKHKIEINRVKDYYKQVCEDDGMTPINDNQLFNKISEMLGGTKPTRTRMEGEYIRQWSGFTLKCELPEEQTTLQK